MSIDVLICTFNKGIAKIEETLLPTKVGVNYIISFQYTDERYLQLLPRQILDRKDVKVFKYRGQGLSNNRNQAMSHASSDILIYADDDTRLEEKTFENVLRVFETHPTLDVALFRATSYIGHLLKQYPSEECDFNPTNFPYHVSTIEMAFRRKSVQGIIRFDERFGLGTKFLTCGEEDIWLYDAYRQGLKVTFFPKTIAKTSIILKQNMIYIDAGVQRSYGAYNYYVYGNWAFWRCLSFACQATLRGFCHFIPTLRHFMEGIKYVRKTT